MFVILYTFRILVYVDEYASDKIDKKKFSNILNGRKTKIYIYKMFIFFYIASEQISYML